MKITDLSSLSLTERHAYILAELSKKGSVSVSELSETLKVSEVTIRKDLSLLEQQKKLYRAHGTAILMSPYISDRHVSEKEKQFINEKRAIGAVAACEIASCDSIIIASGTTMIYFAHELRPVNRLTVITSAVQVTSILSQYPNVGVYQLSGFVRTSSVSVVGKEAEESLRNFHCSKLFMGVDGIDLDFGLTTSNVMEASLNRAMMGASQKVVILTDSSKFGRRGFSKICGLESVDEIITDSNIPPAVLSQLNDMGITVTVVQV